jgi:hypothetical protein
MQDLNPSDRVQIFERARPRTSTGKCSKGFDRYYSELTFDTNPGDPGPAQQVTIVHGQPYPIVPEWLIQAYTDATERPLYLPTKTVHEDDDPDDDEETEPFDDDDDDECEESGEFDFDDDDFDDDVDDDPDLGLPELPRAD